MGLTQAQPNSYITTSILLKVLLPTHMSLQTNSLVTTTLLPHHTPTFYQPHTLPNSHISLALTPTPHSHTSLPHLTPYDLPATHLAALSYLTGPHSHTSLPHLTATSHPHSAWLPHLLHWLLLLHSNVRNTGVYHKGKQVQQKMGWPAEEWREGQLLWQQCHVFTVKP